ncbi:hypothetical protein F4818DRAFT_249252 [Hypoxylon cercidicola]|nr:hypothetical protein F4818DRAFT_249252 [Hypoxylon cercidicola]
MGKDSVKSSGSASHKTKKPRHEESHKSSHSGMSSIERYVGESETHERFAIGEPSGRDPARAQYLQDWDKTWQAASGHKG